MMRASKLLQPLALALALTVSFGGPWGAWAQTARLTGPAAVAPDAPILLNVQGSEGERIRFAARGPEGQIVPVVPLHGAPPASPLLYGMASASEPGRYLFVLLATSGESDEIAFVEVQVGQVQPDPQPPTDPQPQPPANPVFNAEPSRPETFALLKAGQDYGARYSDPTGLALALEFFGQEVLARRSSPSEEAARDWIKQRVQDYGGSPGGAVATALDQAIQAAMEPVYRLEDGVWKLYDREFLAEVLRVLARGIHEGGQS